MSAREITEPERKLPVTHRADVVVCGGSLSGVAAAIAAARHAAYTVLVERYSFLGGSAAAGSRTSLTGLSDGPQAQHPDDAESIAREIVGELIETGATRREAPAADPGAPDVSSLSDCYSISIDADRLKYVLLRMCQQAGVHLLLDTWCSAPVVEGGAARYIIVQSKSGRQALEASVAVDATGDGGIAAAAGAPYETAAADGERDSGMTLMYRIAGVDAGAFEPEDARIAQAEQRKSSRTHRKEREQPAQPTDLSAAAVSARLAARASLDEVRRRRGGEEPPARQAQERTEASPRRHMRGEYVLTAADVSHGRRFDDVVAVIPPCHTDEAATAHDGFDVPYRALVPARVDGLMLAGGCISADAVALAATSLAGPKIAISQAAGTASALCAMHNVPPRQLDVTALQQVLPIRRTGPQRRP